MPLQQIEHNKLPFRKFLQQIKHDKMPLSVPFLQTLLGFEARQHGASPEMSAGLSEDSRRIAALLLCCFFSVFSIQPPFRVYDTMETFNLQVLNDSLQQKQRSSQFAVYVTASVGPLLTREPLSW